MSVLPSIHAGTLIKQCCKIRCTLSSPPPDLMFSARKLAILQSEMQNEVLPIGSDGKRRREAVCENCGKTFTTTRSDVKYCCEECRYEGHIKGQRVRNAKNKAKKTATEEKKTA